MTQPILPVGIREPIGGWDFYRQHLNDVVPCEIEISRPGSKDTFIIKSREAEREVIKVMRENRKKGGN